MSTDEKFPCGKPITSTNNDSSKPRSCLSRRTLLKTAGAGLLGGAALYGMDSLGLFSKDITPLSNNTPPGEMTRRVNPKNGDRLPLLGFGCMRFPVLPAATRPMGPEIDEVAATAIVDHAMAHGVNYFDTAWRYHAGMSEVMIGKALKRYPRESFFLADKMPGVLDPTLEQAKDVFQTQLERCQVEYFDYYLLHSVRTVEAYKRTYEENGVLDFLLEQKAAGRIRNLGWSFHGDQACLEYLLSRPVDWDCAMVQLNYQHLLYKYVPRTAVLRFTPPGRTPAEPRWILERMLQTGIPLMVMEPLLGGRLGRLNKKTLAVLQEENPQASAASWAFRYAAAIPNVITVLSGMTYMEHLQDNLRTFGPYEPLSEREMAVLRRALDVFITTENIPCTLCSYCMPCPYGVDIPAVLNHYNLCVDDEHIPRGARNADYEKARRAFLVGHDRSVPDLSQAIRCTGCNKCLPLCPQDINIPKELERLGKFVEQLRTQA